MEHLTASSIHGRFQPFHNGHLEYFRWAKERSKFVYVGVTQIYNQHDGDFPGAEHRGYRENNPLSFFERHIVIESALCAAGYGMTDFRVIPFPIEDPFRLSGFLDQSITCFTTIHTEWNKHKIKLLQDIGFAVEVLDGNESDVNRASGTEIRKLIQSKSDDWRNYVPIGTYFALTNHNLLHKFDENR